MKINSRQIKILSFILENKSYTMNDIAEKLEISTRTIYRDMKKINEWLIDKAVVGKEHIADAYEVIGDEKAREKINKLLQMNKAEAKYSAEDRQLILITELLLSNEPLKVFYFTQKLNVTEGTIISDLDKVEEWLANYEIMLIRKQGLGIFVEGDEKKIRSCIMSMFYRGLDIRDIRKLIKKKISENFSDRVQTDIANRLLGLVDEATIRQVEQVIKSMEVKLKEKFTDDAYLGLMVHIILAISRLKNGDTIKVSEEILTPIKSTKEYEVADEARKVLQSEFDIDIPDDEVAYITMHLRGAKINNENIEIESSTYLKHDVAGIVKEMLEKAEKETGLDFLTDRDLFMGLVIHLKPALTRLELNLSIRNPLLEAIKNEYKEIFELSRKICQVIEEELDTFIPEEEIGFVAMHIGAFLERKKVSGKRRVKTLVVCPSGLGTSKLLTSKLIKEIEELDILASVSIMEIDRYIEDEKDLELIISTVNLGDREFGYIVVNPLLLEDDIRSIKKAIGIIELDKYEVESAERNVKAKTSKMFDMNKLKAYIEAADMINDAFFVKEGLVIKSCNEMLKYIGRYIHYGDKDNAEKLFQDLKNREDLMGTAITGKKIALVHAKTDTIKDILSGVFRTKGDVVFKDMTGESESIDTVLVLLAGSNASREYRDILSGISVMLVESEDFIPMLRFQDKDEICEALKISFNNFIQNYIKNCQVN
ncbi:MAG: BglG family transcription antiterminator [Eubacteriaceae bacterium]|nr:BglG family transcription antiterminator [Eubacteriaceae bacterium]